jgi:hypothetical protein
VKIRAGGLENRRTPTTPSSAMSHLSPQNTGLVNELALKKKARRLTEASGARSERSPHGRRRPDPWAGVDIVGSPRGRAGAEQVRERRDAFVWSRTYGRRRDPSPCYRVRPGYAGAWAGT